MKSAKILAFIENLRGLSNGRLVLILSTVSELAEKHLTSELLEWADIVFVMEDYQKEFISKKFPELYFKKKIINLDIPDMYNYMDEELVKVLEEKVKI